MSDDIFSGSDQLISKLKGELADALEQSNSLRNENVTLRVDLDSLRRDSIVLRAESNEQKRLAGETLESVNRIGAKVSGLLDENKQLQSQLDEQKHLYNRHRQVITARDAAVRKLEDENAVLRTKTGEQDLSLKGLTHQASVLREERDSLEGERKNLRTCNDNLIADLGKERALLRKCMERNRVLLRNIYCNERDEVLTSLNKQLACNVENHNQQVARNQELVSANAKLTDENNQLKSDNCLSRDATVTELSQQLENLQRNYDTAKKEPDELRKQITAFSRIRSDLEAQIGGFKEQLEDKTAAHQALDAMYSRNLLDVGTYREEVSTLRKQNAEHTAACSMYLEHIDELTRKLEQQIEPLVSIGDVQRLRDELTAHRRGCEALRLTLEQVTKERDTLKATNERLSLDYKHCYADAEMILAHKNADAAELDRVVSQKFELIKVRDSLNLEQKELVAQVERLRSELATVYKLRDKALDETREVKNLLEESRDERDKVTKSRDTLNTMYVDSNNMLLRLRKDYEADIGRRNSQYARIQELESVLEKSGLALSKATDELEELKKKRYTLTLERDSLRIMEDSYAQQVSALVLEKGEVEKQRDKFYSDWMTLVTERREQAYRNTDWISPQIRALNEECALLRQANDSLHSSAGWVLCWQEIIGVTSDGIIGPVTNHATHQWRIRHGLTPGFIPTHEAWVEVKRCCDLVTPQLTELLDVCKMYSAEDFPRFPSISELRKAYLDYRVSVRRSNESG